MTEPTLQILSGTSGNTLVGTGSTVQTSTAAHTQDTSAYEEPMFNYAYSESQHGSSSVPGVPFHPSHPSVTSVPTQWQAPPSVFGHHSQPAPGPSTTNSYTHNNSSQAYAAATGATGTPQGEQLSTLNV